MLTCQCNKGPLTSHFYIVKLWFTWVFIIFFIFALKHRFWELGQVSSKFAAAINGQVSSKFAAAKNGQVSSKFAAGKKNGQVSSKFAAAKNGQVSSVEPQISHFVNFTS